MSIRLCAFQHIIRVFLGRPGESFKLPIYLIAKIGPKRKAARNESGDKDAGGRIVRQPGRRRKTREIRVRWRFDVRKIGFDDFQNGFAAELGYHSNHHGIPGRKRLGMFFRRNFGDVMPARKIYSVKRLGKLRHDTAGNLPADRIRQNILWDVGGVWVHRLLVGLGNLWRNRGA